MKHRPRCECIPHKGHGLPCLFSIPDRNCLLLEAPILFKGLFEVVPITFVKAFSKGFLCLFVFGFLLKENDRETNDPEHSSAMAIDQGSEW